MGEYQIDEYTNQLITLFRNDVFTYILRFVGNEPDADDITQIASMRLCVYLRAHPERLKYPKIYFRKIAERVYLNRCRSEQRTTESLEQEIVVNLSGRQTSPIEQLHDTHYQPDELAQSNEGIKRIGDEIAALPREVDRQVIAMTLNYVSLREIAETLDISVSTVKSIRKRVRMLLHEKLVLREKQRETSHVEQI